MSSLASYFASSISLCFSSSIWNEKSRSAIRSLNPLLVDRGTGIGTGTSIAAVDTLETSSTDSTGARGDLGVDERAVSGREEREGMGVFSASI